MSGNTEPGGDGLDALGALASSATAPPAEVPEGLRARVLASKKRPGRYGLFVDRVARLFDLPIAKAETLMQKLASPDAWVPFVVPGTEVVPFEAGPKYAGAIATLIRIKPGMPFPEHTHHGDETMVILDGGFVELHSKRERWRGEELISLDGTAHALVALPGRPCVVAALNSGYVDFK